MDCFGFWEKLEDILKIVRPLANAIAKTESNDSCISEIPMIRSMLEFEFLPAVQDVLEHEEYAELAKYVLEDEFRLMDKELFLSGFLPDRFRFPETRFTPDGVELALPVGDGPLGPSRSRPAPPCR